MPINACSINRHTINGRCGIISPIVPVVGKGHVRNIPPQYYHLKRDIDDAIINTENIEQQYVTISIELAGDIETITFENMPIDASQIAYINRLNINVSPITLEVVDLRLEKVKEHND